ncbi:MAG: hypothetical protein KC877_04760 [Candidatus Kaiserbacteria bacterium]|nr:hypothetical protein [Candidatus Kaiserbacteria bacterium]MCB9815767.1 hypothetical protein [Candidatus Nomurabacteria bacterium]
MGSKELTNPLAFASITDFLAAVLQVFIIMATPIVIFFLIYAGFSYVTARGNPAKIELASKSLLYGAIGGVVILGSVAIMTIIKNLVAAF